jgi:hypothetical protein
MIPGVRFGILGVTYAYSAWTLFSGLLNLHLIGRYMETSAGAILASVVQIAWIAGAMGALVYVVDAGPAHVWPFAIRLIAGILVGVGSYAALCIVSRNEAFTDFVRLVLNRFGPSARPYWVK